MLVVVSSTVVVGTVDGVVSSVANATVGAVNDAINVAARSGRRTFIAVFRLIAEVVSLVALRPSD